MLLILRLSFHLFCPLIMIIWSTSACSDLQNADQTIDSQAKIINGDKEYDYPSVVGLRGNSIYCTGTLITPQIVLTAAHCLSTKTGTQIPIDVVILEEGTVKQTLRVDDWILHSDWEGQILLNTDLALLYLNAEANQEPLSIDTEDANTYVGQLGKIIGYGRNNVDPNIRFGLKMSVDLMIQEYNHTHDMYTLASHDEVVRSACYGDSGGPLLVGEKILAVSSYIRKVNDESCMGTSHYTHVAPHLEWIHINIPTARYGRRYISSDLIDLRTDAEKMVLNDEPDAVSTEEEAYRQACHDFYQCFTQCESSDLGCKERCDQDASMEAKSRYYSIISCYKDHECQGSLCLYEYCSDTLTACSF